MFGLFGKKKDEPTHSLSFDEVPDGTYNAKLMHEIGGQIGGEDTILFTFLITDGELNGRKAPAKFTGTKVKAVLNESSGDYMMRLSAEEDARASRYEDWSYEKNMSTEIDDAGNYTGTKPVPIKVKDGLITNIKPIPEPD